MEKQTLQIATIAAADGGVGCRGVALALAARSSRRLHFNCGGGSDAHCGSVTDGADNICMDEREREREREDERNRLWQSTHDERGREGERERKRGTCFAFAVLSTTNEPLHCTLPLSSDAMALAVVVVKT